MTSRPYTVFMLLKATAAWLALSADQRTAIYDGALLKVFNRFPEVRLRFFDASAFHGRCSDVLVWETSDMPEYRNAVDALRCDDLLAQPYFDVLDVIPSMADGGREPGSSALPAWA
ncbi:darcynin family protein [Ideonella sp.]|uniref:darcynin family protein n=1 Tax=Ideonella sp. TaxID=1929293 RepID=UPI0035B04214